MTELVRLKSWPAFFKAIKNGEKLHDIRDMRDRKFYVGQHLILAEYDPFLGRYSGNEVEVEVTYITSNDTPCALSSAVLERGFCVLSIKVHTNGDQSNEGK
jgi:hypothetical protein